MNVIVLHNRYQIAGGEDVVVAAEVALLRAQGHAVTLIEVDNHAIGGWRAKAATALATPYNAGRRRWIAAETARLQADVVHVHNYFPLLSPAVLDGAADVGAAVVHTLHNYRSICAAATMMRDGKTCESCVGGSGWQAVRHRCYRNSAVGSAAVVAMQHAARRRKVWDRPGRRLIALSAFARDRFGEGGLPLDRIVVKPNSIDCANPVRHPSDRRGVLYVGRLSAEKGIGPLIEAARGLPDIPFCLVGEGRERFSAHLPPNVELTGSLSRETARMRIATARVLVLPSLWPEGLPMVLLEAFAAGTPVVASRIGALAEWIEDGAAGALFNPGDADALALQIGNLYFDQARAHSLGLVGRALAETRFSPDRNVAALETVYRDAVAELR